MIVMTLCIIIPPYSHTKDYVNVMYINNTFHTLSIIHVHVEMTNDTCTCT